MTLSFILDSVLALLLTATLIYCALLERRLRHLRRDQSSLTRHLEMLSGAITEAERSLKYFAKAAAEADEHLGRKTTNARALADELSLLTASGERIASRIEQSAVSAPRHAMASASASNLSLRAVR